MLSYAAGGRMLQLMGGVNLSFYDWYCDLPNASPETWGEQTDVNESADWFHAKFLAVMGANLNMTRTPDVHFACEARTNGSKMVVFAPDFNQVAKYADEWIPINAGQDGAWWMAVNHVILKEFHHEQQNEAFLDYTRKFTDAPFLVEIEEGSGRLQGRPAPARRSPESLRRRGERRVEVPPVGSRRGTPEDADGELGAPLAGEEGAVEPALRRTARTAATSTPRSRFLDDNDEVVQVALDDFGGARSIKRGVPVKRSRARRRQAGPGGDGLRPPDGPVRRRARPRGRLPESYDEDSALHARLGGALHRHGPRRRSSASRVSGRRPPTTPAASAPSSSARASTTGTTPT